MYVGQREIGGMRYSLLSKAADTSRRIGSATSTTNSSSEEVQFPLCEVGGDLKRSPESMRTIDIPDDQPYTFQDSSADRLHCSI